YGRDQSRRAQGSQLRAALCPQRWLGGPERDVLEEHDTVSERYDRRPQGRAHRADGDTNRGSCLLAGTAEVDGRYDLHGRPAIRRGRRGSAKRNAAAGWRRRSRQGADRISRRIAEEELDHDQGWFECRGTENVRQELQLAGGKRGERRGSAQGLDSAPEDDD